MSLSKCFSALPALAVVAVTIMSSGVVTNVAGETVAVGVERGVLLVRGGVLSVLPIGI